MPLGTTVARVPMVPSRASVGACNGRSKRAVHVLFADMSTAPFTLQAPVHPPNTLPALGDAVSVTLALTGNAAEHVAPQLMPAGDEVIVPLPVPARVTVSVARLPPAAVHRMWCAPAMSSAVGASTSLTCEFMIAA